MAHQLFFRHALLPAGWASDVRVTIADGLIEAMESGVVPVGEQHAIALPGMINLHSHSFQRAIASLTESRGPTADSFWTWRELMYRFGLAMNPDDIEIAATQAFIEMLEGGFTAVAEFHYLHHAPDGTPYDDIAELAVRVAAAAARVGIDLVLLPVFYAHGNFGGAPPADLQRRFINDLDGFSEIHARCQKLAPTGVAPHSLRAVTPDELTALIGIADGSALHIHIAEQIKEVEDCVAWSGTRPVAWLLEHAPVGENWCLIHATQTLASELAAVAARGATIGLCPITESNLGDGIFPARHYSGGFGIGTDSNVLISVAQELRTLEYSQRLLHHDRNVMARKSTPGTATALYQGTIEGGARAIASVGGIAVGAPANIVTLAGDNPEIALAQWVFSGRTVAVETAWVRGRKCVTGSRHPLASESGARFDMMVRRRLLG